MVRVEMRDQDGVDRGRLDAGGGKIVEQGAGAVDDLARRAGIDQHQPAPGIDQQSGEVDLQHAGRQERRGERGLDLGIAGIADEIVFDLERPQAVIDRGHLIGAEPEAIGAAACRFAGGAAANDFIGSSRGGDRGRRDHRAPGDCIHASILIEPRLRPLSPSSS